MTDSRTEARRPRVSIRYQILLTVLILVGASVSAYMAYVTRYIVNDKLAYAYDLNASLAHTRAQEIRANLETLTGRLHLVASEVRRSDESADEIENLLESGGEVVALELWERRAQRFVQTSQILDDAALARLDVDPTELAASRREAGITPKLASAEGLVLRNTSLPPDTALLTLAVASKDGSWVIIADVEPTQLARLLGQNTLYEAVLLDPQGGLLAHPDRSRMIARENLADRASVAAALESNSTRGVLDVEDGKVLSAFSKLDVGRLILVSEIAKAEALRAAEELQTRTLLFGLLALLATLIVSIAVSRRLARPLRELERAATAVRDGELGARAEIHSANEMGSLAHAFNAMSAELAKRDDELKGAYASLQKADRLALLGAVTAGVAHELRNPLTYVIASADFVDEFVKELPNQDTDLYEAAKIEETHQWLADLRRGLGQIDNIVKDLGKTSSARTRAEAVDVSTVMHHAVKMASHQLKGVTQIEEDYRETRPVVATASRLSQVFLNLVLNAGQALSKAHSEENRITLRTSMNTDGWIVAEVSDNGPGIPPELVERVFDQFFTTKGENGGTGLGLAISQSIVQSVGGRIEIDNVPGEGVTFRILLPPQGAESRPPLRVAETDDSDPGGPDDQSSDDRRVG